ncbi:MAG: mechanosensitive ion channel [Balneolales bacterium]|nr:mechanosensitive ion channel [Balneolales bacterium]
MLLQNNGSEESSENGNAGVELLDTAGSELANFFFELWEFLGTGIFQIQGTPVTLGSILIFSSLLVFFLILSRLVSTVLYRRILRKVAMDESIRYTLQRVTSYVILILGVMFSFQFIGIDLSGLAVIFGLLSVGIGFGLQNLTSNFISGIILLFERPISVGDRIIVGELEGDVQEINIRSTTINSIDNISIIVPNADFISGRVVNYSHGDTRIRINVEVGVSYNSDLDLVLETIKSVAISHSEVLAEPAPVVLLKHFGDSSWDMLLRCWIENPKRHPFVASDLRCEIVRAFRKNNIEIPFPQRDLHLRSPKEISFSRTDNQQN